MAGKIKDAERQVISEAIAEIQAMPKLESSHAPLEEHGRRLRGNPRAARVRRALKALRTPDPSLARVANTVRQSIADVIEELVRDAETLEQRQRDTDWLQQAAFQILHENNIMPSSRDLIKAYKRATEQTATLEGRA